MLLGYPIPGIFLIKQGAQRYLVLDGQQRLKTLQSFYDGLYAASESAFSNMSYQFKDLTDKGLPGPNVENTRFGSNREVIERRRR